MKKGSFICLILLILIAGCRKEEIEIEEVNTVTLTLWDIYVTYEEQKVIKAAIDKWHKENPNIRIERESLKDAPYRKKIATAVAANEQPDLFLGWAGGQVDPFIQAGKVLRLDNYISENIINKAKSGVLDNVTRNGGLYGLPFAVWTGVLYCNQELFDRAGLELPETYSELLNVIDVFNTMGIGALGTSGEAWVGMFYHNILTLKNAGCDITNAALAGEVPFNSKDFVDSAKLFEELIEKNSFNRGYMGMDYDAVQAVFLAGQIPMLYVGDWLAGECELDSSAVKGKINVIDFPYIEGKEEFKNHGLGGAVDSFFVSASTRYPVEATRFLEFLVNEMSFEGARIGRNFPAYNHKRYIDISKANRVRKQVAQIAKERTGFTLSWDTILPLKGREIHLEGVMELFTGAITAEEFSEKMQRINE